MVVKILELEILILQTRPLVENFNGILPPNHIEGLTWLIPLMFFFKDKIQKQLLVANVQCAFDFSDLLSPMPLFFL